MKIKTDVYYNGDETTSEKTKLWEDVRALGLYLSSQLFGSQYKIILDNTTHNCNTDFTNINIGAKVERHFKIKVIDALLHELLHIKLPKLKEYSKWSFKQVNFCQDLEINNILGLNKPEMNVVHPSKMGLSTGLTTLEYLELLFPDGKPDEPETPDEPGAQEFDEPGEGNRNNKQMRSSANANSVESDAIETELEKAREGKSQFGDQFLEKFECCKIKSDKQYNAQLDIIIAERFEMPEGDFLEFKYDELVDTNIINFLSEAKMHAQTSVMSTKVTPTYIKMSRRSHDPRLIIPGLKKEKFGGNRMTRIPALLLDCSGSMGMMAEKGKSIVGYVKDDFILHLYDDNPIATYTPGDLGYMFKPAGSTNALKSVTQILQRNPEIGDIYVITDGEDKTLTAASRMVHETGRKFQVLRINSHHPARRILY